MKPISYATYFNNHRKKIISVVIVLALSIFLIGEIDSFVNSMVSTQSRDFEKYKYFSHVAFVGGKVDVDILNEIKEHESIEMVLKTYDYSLKIPSVGANAKFKGYVLGQNDIVKLIDKMGIGITSGELPQSDQKQIIVNNHILRANDLDINEYYDIKDESYLISGVLEGDNVISFIADEDPEKSKEYLVVFKDGMMDEATMLLNSYSKTKLNVWGYYDNVDFVEASVANTKTVLYLVIAMSIIFLSIIIGSYSYVFYLHRIREFGVLKAIGFSKKKLLSKVLLEILITSFAGLAIGLILMLVVNGLFNILYMYPNGNASIQIRLGMIPMLLPIPLAVSLFIFFPTSKMLNKINPITIIERTGQ